MERHFHVPRERDRPGAGLDLGPDQGVHPLDVGSLAGVKIGESGQGPHHPSPRAAAIMAPVEGGGFEFMRTSPRTPMSSVHRAPSGAAGG